MGEQIEIMCQKDIAWGDTGIGNRTAQYAPIFPTYRDGRHFFDA